MPSLCQIAVAVAAVVCRATGMKNGRPRMPGQWRLTTELSADQPGFFPPNVPMPPQFPRTYEERWFEQPVDHFNMLQPLTTVGQQPTFKQRYLYYDSYWKGPGSPIIFYTGAEGPGVDEIWDHSGWIVDTLARNLSALVVFAEHRFFGKSFPFGSAACELYPKLNTTCESSFWPNATRLGLLAEEQTLEDFAELSIHLRDTLKAWRSPLISVGGSLAGELTAYFRYRYPHIVDAALAASAPILGYPGYTSEFGWYRVVTETFRRVGGDECVENIRAGFWMLADMSPAELSKNFNTCTPATRVCDYQMLTEPIYDWCGGASEAGYPPSRSSIKLVCDAMAGASTPLEAWQRLWAPTPPAKCLNISWRDCYDEQTYNGHRTNAETKTMYSGPENLFNDGWDYLACTSEVHPIGSNNITDFLPPRSWSLNSTMAWCQYEFNNRNINDPNAGPATKVFMRPKSMAYQFGIGDLEKFSKSTSRIIFSSGQNDPWSAQSITKTLSPSLPAIVISNGAHHSDLGGPLNPVPDPKTDTQGLIMAREFEISTLRGWIQEINSEREKWHAADAMEF